jgi:hypothetical protein
VVHLGCVVAAALVVERDSQVPVGREARDAADADAVFLLDLLVVRRIDEGQRQDSLLLQVGLVDAREAANDHGRGAEQPR